MLFKNVIFIRYVLVGCFQNTIYTNKVCSSKVFKFLFTLIKSLYDKGYGYTRISYKLNDCGLQKPRGKKWFNTSMNFII